MKSSKSKTFGSSTGTTYVKSGDYIHGSNGESWTKVSNNQYISNTGKSITKVSKNSWISSEGDSWTEVGKSVTNSKDSHLNWFDDDDEDDF